MPDEAQEQQNGQEQQQDISTQAGPAPQNTGARNWTMLGSAFIVAAGLAYGGKEIGAGLSAPQDHTPAMPKATCPYDLSSGSIGISSELADCMNGVIWGLNAGAYKGGQLNNDNGKFEKIVVLPKDVEWTIIPQDPAGDRGSLKGSFICNIKPEERAEDKMLVCRVAGWDAGFEADEIEYIFQ